MFDDGAVQTLRSVVAALRSESLGELPDARVEGDLVELHEVLEELEAERLRRLGELDRRRLFERDGFLSATAWLASRCRVAWSAAREQVATARALHAMERVRAAFEAGEVSMAGVRVLASAQQAETEAFASAEELLTEAAARHSIGDLRRVVAFWREQVARERAADGEDLLHARRRLHASVSLDGMVRVDGDLDPTTGESVLTALQAVMDAEARSGRGGEDRTPPQQRADALGEICRQWLDHGTRPSVAGERPHLNVTVSSDALSSTAAPAELEHAGLVGIHEARRLACDASVLRVVTDPGSQPLDVGRRTPVVSPAIRRGVIVRDRHCRFPGCDRPQAWCDAHHVVHWADGGRTALENLLLLCRRHHGLVHRLGGFRLAIEEGAPVFRRSDGSVLEDRGPP